MPAASEQEHVGDEILARCMIPLDGVAGSKKLGRAACLRDLGLWQGKDPRLPGK